MKPEGPTPGAQRADSGGGVLEEGKLALSQPARWSGETPQAPQPSPGGASAAKRFYYIPQAPAGLSWNLLRPSSGEAWPLGHL